MLAATAQATAKKFTVSCSTRDVPFGQFFCPNLDATSLNISNSNDKDC